LLARTVDPAHAKDAWAKFVEHRVVKFEPAPRLDQSLRKALPQEFLPTATLNQQPSAAVVMNVLETFRQLDRIGFSRSIPQGYEVKGHQDFHLFSARETGSLDVTLT
jgi:hypothetical protein